MVFDPKFGLSTLVTHVAEGNDPLHAHVMPIYQTSTFGFENVAASAAIFEHEAPGYVYTRLNNPNQQQLAEKIAALEGLDLLRAQPTRKPEEVVGALVFSSGMAAVTSAILAGASSGQTIIAQENLYSATFNFLKTVAPRYGIGVVLVKDPTPEAWEAAFSAHPEATLAYAETPTNPTMSLTDLRAAAEAAHRHNARLLVDNTFATPYCQRPLTLGADVVLHSTTKYISGHAQVIGGAVVSNDLAFLRGPVYKMLEILGGSPSPFDCWLASSGLKTFELRMQRHCENALQVARFLEGHASVARVHYPGLESHPEYELACRQMSDFGGMLSFELKGGMQAGIKMMETVRVCSLAVSLGAVDSLITHPASTTHHALSPEERHKVGLTDGMVRFSVGIENIEDLLADLDQAMA